MWNLLPAERLQEWREFRLNLNNLSLEQAIQETSHLWSYAPFVKRYLSYDLPENWPNPWELLHDNYYCDLAKALGMFYTLYLSSHYNVSITDLALEVYQDHEEKELRYIVSVNKGKYILNMIFDTVLNKKSITKNLRLKNRHTANSLHLSF